MRVNGRRRPAAPPPRCRVRADARRRACGRRRPRFGCRRASEMLGRMRAMNAPAHTLAMRIDAALPQTQCTRCGFAGCQPYAEALAAGASDINRCPPGGDAVIAELAALTGRRGEAARPGVRRARPPARRRHRRGRVHRLHAVHRGLPGRRDHRRAEAHARGPAVAVFRMRVVRRALSGRLHRDGRRRPRVDAGDADAARIRHAARARASRSERISQRTAVAQSADAERATRQAAIAAAMARARARRGT